MPNGYIYSWNGTTSANFGVASNWFNQTTGATATVAPGVNDQATITSAGSVVGSGNVYNLGLTGSSGTLTIAATLAGTNLFLASNVGVASGASLVFSNIIQIGDYAAGSIVSHVAANLTINAGGLIRGTLPTTGAYAFYIGQSGGTGTMTISGQGALADAGARGFDVGNAGTGAIILGAGGRITGGTGDSYQAGGSSQIGLTLGDPSGNGTLIVAGSGAGATFGDLVEAGFGGNGIIAIQSGGTLSAGDGSFALDIADQQSGANGTGNVGFSAATGTLNGLTEVGTYGSGTLALSAGSTLTMIETSNSASASDWSALVGVQSGASGTIGVASQSLLTAGHGFAIGVSGHGELDIDGGQVKLSSPTGGNDLALDVGLQAGSSGIVGIARGSLQDVSGTGMVIGGSGSGTVSVYTGGTLISGGGAASGLILGEASGSSGSLLVTGSGATLTVTGEFQDGSAGTGSFTLSGGAHATINAISPNAYAGLALSSDGGTGQATITGAGTVLKAEGQLLVGGAGSATLTVSSGASFALTTASGQTIPDAIIASSSRTAVSTVAVTGSGSSWAISDALIVGNTGHGALTIQSGGHVSAGSVSVGGFSGSIGTILVAGSLSRLTTTTLQIGASGATATATVSAATLDVTGNATITGGGLSLSHNGTFQTAGTLTIGSGSFAHGIGTLQAGSIVDQGVITVNGGTMRCIGPITGDGTLRIMGGGNLVLGTGAANTIGIAFGAGSTLTAASVSEVAGTITGWTTGDVMHFTNAKIVSDTVSGNVASLFNANHQLVGTLTFGGAAAAHSFALTAENSGTLLTFHR